MEGQQDKRPEVSAYAKSFGEGVKQDTPAIRAVVERMIDDWYRTVLGVDPNTKAPMRRSTEET
jgi:hypothetical protein